ncbi:MAG: dTMP kinase [Candidatus Coatesbacteria bacterium]|nr:dTMP kinase [Candidatus Coatesbacteria bacterium]
MGNLLGGDLLRLFISFEGVEGSGKTTQVEMLHNYLVEMRISVLKTREPGGTALGDRLRPILLEHSDAPCCPLSELFLYAAARAQLVKEVIAPALDHHTVVISDRYVDSTVAYQGYARGLDISLIERLNRSATNGCMPHLTVLLDTDPEVGLNRISSRALTLLGCGKDRLESESLHFHRQVRKGYQILADRNPDRFFVVNGRRNKEDIHQQIKHELIRRYPESFPLPIPARNAG